ncbi:PREDICTED: interleukin-3 receptor subunit alpha isoform X1 [Hipposideros armiger]|uniref:Interleukin-3 receptor subunit alpha n=2 Tax=Hipposideros armiger TaxID=186990 RepID=A0A8B7QFW3_HIPAR|nr:PREDICTED: interleukin-3 receptor subunit alpha isoform X1 [Hipposideros armiger]
MALLWLAAFLTPVSCVLPTDRSHHQVPSADPQPPIKNLRMETKSKMLAWDVTGNISSIKCFKDSKNSSKGQTQKSCTFYVLPKCKASNYTVNVTTVDGKSFSTWIRYPEQEGNPGAAAQGLECQVHDVDFLTCGWKVGPEAPSDVQYSSYLENVKTENKWECPRHTANGLGIHVQCQFKGLSRFPHVQYRFLVNGNSTHSSIPCAECIMYLSHIEELSPPNMTVSCNKSHSVIEWKTRSHFYRKIEYELEIQKGTDDPYTQKAHLKTSLILSSPGVYTVKVRAMVLRYTNQKKGTSQWSAPQRIACHQDENAPLHFWLTPLLIALATLTFAGCALLLCKRYSLRQKLFPPIPHMKDPIGDGAHTENMLAWESDRAGPEECPVAKVQVLGEK